MTSLSELLFWRVYRNLITRNEIFSNLNHNSGCGKGGTIYKKFNQIYHVSWIIKNGYIELLRYKVDRNDQLLPDFSNGSGDVNKTYFFREIFMAINKDNQDNTKFYKSLFKNYNKFIENYEKLLELSVDENCIPAIKVLLNDYHLKLPVIEQSYNSIILSSNLKFVKYLLGAYNQQETGYTVPQQVMEYSLIINNLNFKSYKVLLYLIVSNIIKIIPTKPKTKLQQDKIKEIQSRDNGNLDNIQSIFKVWSLSDLFNTCNLIGTMNEILGLSVKHQLSTNEIGQLKNTFSKIELKSNLQLFIDQSTTATCGTGKKESVIKLLKFYFSIQGKSQSYNLPFYYYQFCGGIGEMDEHIDGQNEIVFGFGKNDIERLSHSCKSDHFISSLKYGSLIYWRNVSNNFDYENKYYSSFLFEFLVEKYMEKENPLILFKNCKNWTLQMKFQFIERVVSYEVIGNPTNWSKLKLLVLLFLVIEIDDGKLEIVKFIHGQLQLHNVVLQSIDNNTRLYNAGFQIQRFIKSIEMCNFCMDNFKDHFLVFGTPDTVDYYYNFSTIELLQGYQKLMNFHFNGVVKRIRSNITNFKKVKNISTIQRYLSTIKYCSSKMKIGKVEFNHPIEFPTLDIKNYQFTTEILPELIEIIKFENVNYNPLKIIPPKYNHISKYHCYLFINQILKHHKNDLTKCQFDKHSLFDIYYSTGNLKKFVKLYTLPTNSTHGQYLVHGLYNVCHNGDIDSLIYLNEIFKSKTVSLTDKQHSSFTDYLSRGIERSSRNGHLNILEYLYTEYPNLFITNKRHIKKEAINPDQKSLSHHHITKFLNKIK